MSEIHIRLTFTEHRCLKNNKCLFDYVEWKSKMSSVGRGFSAKMKATLVCCALMSLYMCATACELQMWRGNEIYCCKNGTAFGKGASRVWVEQRPLLCAAKTMHENSLSGWKIVVIVITITSMVIGCCQCVYCIAGKVLFGNDKNKENA